eukprot:3501220-Prymnesium_polylepis.2
MARWPRGHGDTATDRIEGCSEMATVRVAVGHTSMSANCAAADIDPMKIPMATAFLAPKRNASIVDPLYRAFSRASFAKERTVRKLEATAAAQV